MSDDTQVTAIENWLAAQHEVLLRLLENCARNDVECFVVGGALRDILLGRGEVSDIDLLVTGPSPKLEEVKNRFADDVLSARPDMPHVDFIAGDDPKPVVEAFEFTVNALYFDVQRKKLFDPTGRALADLRDRKLAPILAARFVTSAVEPIRLARFHALLNLSIAPGVVALMKEYAPVQQAASPRHHALAINQFFRLLAVPEASPGIRLLADTGILGALLPDLLPALKSSNYSPLPSIDDLDSKLVHLDQNERSALLQVEKGVATISGSKTRTATEWSKLARLRLRLLFENAIEAFTALDGEGLPNVESYDEMTLRIASRLSSAPVLASRFNDLGTDLNGRAQPLLKAD